jgi:hypothetical protein
MTKDEEEGIENFSDQELLITDHVTEEGNINKFENLFTGMNRTDIT